MVTTINNLEQGQNIRLLVNGKWLNGKVLKNNEQTLIFTEECLSDNYFNSGQSMFINYIKPLKLKNIK